MGENSIDYILVDSQYISKVNKQSLELLDQHIQNLELVIMKNSIYHSQIKAGRLAQMTKIKENGPVKIGSKVRDALYFEQLQARKDIAIKEFSIVQKAIHREKLKDTDMFKTQK